MVVIFWFQQNLRRNIIYLSFIRGFMKKITHTTSGATVFVFKYRYMWLSNSLLQRYNQIGNLTLSALFEVLKIM